MIGLSSLPFVNSFRLIWVSAAMEILRFSLLNKSANLKAVSSKIGTKNDPHQQGFPNRLFSNDGMYFIGGDPHPPIEIHEHECGGH